VTRIALFGGSFNPPHIGHVMDVAYILACVDVDTVWLTPTYQHAFGKSLVTFEHRMAMTRTAMSMFGERVVISDIERQIGGESRTIHVVDRLLAEQSEMSISLVVGSDILDELHLWLEHERLLATVELIVLRRTGYNADDPRVMGPLIPEVSSTAVRAALAAGDFDTVAGDVPHAVLQFIRRHRLYVEG